MKIIVNLSILLFVAIASYGQNNTLDDDTRLKDIMFNTFHTNSLEQDRQGQANFQNNEVFIQQIGNGNNINSQVSAEKRTLNYTQLGDYNSINVKVNAEKIQQNIIQNGNANNVFDFSNAPSQEVSLNLSQNGNNLHFERYGSNSIGDKLEFNMTGNSKSIIIRNFQ